MPVTVARGLERRLQRTVVLLIRSDDPPEQVAAGVRRAVPDIATTGVIPATGEEVIAGEVLRKDGTRWRPTDREWEDDDLLAGADRPSYVAEPVTVPGGQLLVIDYALPPGVVELASGRFELTIGEPEQWVPGHRDHDATRARAWHILPL
jgi:hypothetical protein